MVAPYEKLHPRMCDICKGNAEKPHRVIWDSNLEERVSFCSHRCFKRYQSTIAMARKRNISTATTEKKENCFLRCFSCWS